ncbi:MAG: thiolase domain-containing protein [Betaproteobacteria bacterium]|nr:thiolase domain-containing protein [Betaproteobacteria bacterium]
MSLSGAAYIAGAFEHPTRFAPDKSVALLHAECARGALDDAGLTFRDVDAYFCGGEAPGASPAYMADYLNLNLKHLSGGELGGSGPIGYIGHAAAAIQAGKCDVALITMAGRPRAVGQATGTEKQNFPSDIPFSPFDVAFNWSILTIYGSYARRHMHEFGTTSEQMAWVKVSASHHAQHNPNARLRQVFTVEEVVNSRFVADPLHMLDCCVITDGGGGLVVTRPEIAKSLKRPLVKLRGHGQAMTVNNGGMVDMVHTGAALSGPLAFAEAGVRHADIKYASVYDNFTIMVVMQLEDLGFCKKGEGGRFVMDGNLISGVGKLPWNTDGGGMCNNHPINRGGMTKAIEAVRQLRGEAHPRVQVPDCNIALASGPGLINGVGHYHSTAILERE